MVMHHKTCRRFRSDRLAPKCAPNRAYWRMAFPRLALRICGQFLRHHIAHTHNRVTIDLFIRPAGFHLRPTFSAEEKNFTVHARGSHQVSIRPPRQRWPISTPCSDVLASRRCTMAVIDTSRLVVSSDVDHTASGLGADKSGARRGRGRPWVGSLSDATSPESTM